jgi:CheY-like chemotaxis protein
MIKKVLCVDDDMVTLAIFKRILSKAQTIEKIETALNGQEALDLLLNMQQHQITLPDIILLDLNMPVLDGWGFVEKFQREFQSNKSDLKIMIVTSSIDPEDQNRAKQYDFIVDYVTKPFGVEFLGKLNQL